MIVYNAKALLYLFIYLFYKSFNWATDGTNNAKVARKFLA